MLEVGLDWKWSAKVFSELLQAEIWAATEEHAVGLANQPSDSPCSIGGVELNRAPNPLWCAAGIDPNLGSYKDNIGDTCNTGVGHSGGSNVGGSSGFMNCIL
jgi:hypothetical protein